MRSTLFLSIYLRTILISFVFMDIFYIILKHKDTGLFLAIKINVYVKNGIYSPYLIFP